MRPPGGRRPAGCGLRGVPGATGNTAIASGVVGGATGETWVEFLVPLADSWWARANPQAGGKSLRILRRQLGELQTATERTQAGGIRPDVVTPELLLLRSRQVE